MTPRQNEALSIYARAASYICDAGLDAEIAFHRELQFEKFTESELLRESAWVILCSGFRESTVRRMFDHISLCYCDWESAREIVAAGPACEISAKSVFRNSAKLSAISSVARQINDVGFMKIKKAILQNPIETLLSFPFIGPITATHLAKNIGLNIAKPDRHLVRLSTHIGFDSVDELCAEIGELVGETARVVDLVLWRYMADNPSWSQRVHR